MNTPKFLFAPDPKNRELYIIHTQFPLSVIWVKQETPAKLLVMECEFYENDGEIDDDLTDDETTILSAVLTDAAEWYRINAIRKSN